MGATGGFEDFYERHHARVLGVLSAVSGDRQAAIDATDEAFVRALERWKRVGTMDSPAATCIAVSPAGLVAFTSRPSSMHTFTPARRSASLPYSYSSASAF